MTSFENIPTDVKNIIYKFQQELFMNDVLRELIEVFDTCCCCNQDKPRFFNDTCNGCDGYICNNCYTTHFKDNPNITCNECYNDLLAEYEDINGIDWMNF